MSIMYVPTNLYYRAKGFLTHLVKLDLLTSMVQQVLEQWLFESLEKLRSENMYHLNVELHKDHERNYIHQSSLLDQDTAPG